jgi:hypothetical protein
MINGECDPIYSRDLFHDAVSVMILLNISWDGMMRDELKGSVSVLMVTRPRICLEELRKTKTNLSQG